ncbi:Heat shock protein [Nesidiocoris tenuis]|uniref:Heat shock protein 83 n=1 Tax=Nesidiocoris tenuis TaxID=355587 RepID=A0ABN7AFB4_9HEMI|nr:Heat shock protein [Nesidiocoris tenuis]
MNSVGVALRSVCRVASRKVHLRRIQNPKVLCFHDDYASPYKRTSHARYYSAETIEKAKPSAAPASDESHSFQAETQMLLNMVANSLYSDKEVFLRELVSNACDALEKLRFHNIETAGSDSEAKDLKIEISANKQDMLLVIEDNGVGMTKEELIKNLGTIARSGSRAFIEDMKKQGKSDLSNSVIGQFGVGFYSVFMVAKLVEVFTKSKTDSQGYKWSCDGSSTFHVEKVDKQDVGTKIVLHLKPEAREFSDSQRIEDLVKKYSNFVRFPIKLNGNQINSLEPLWVMEPKSVSLEKHVEFYKFISNSFDKPRFVLHYKADAPVNINALLYFPEGKPGMFDGHDDKECGVALYARRVLIKSKASEIVPKWLRFVKGVIDSEDIPLNISRELLQNSSLLRKLKSVITSRVLKFLLDKSLKDTEEYLNFYQDYSLYLKEGIILSESQSEKEDIAKLLRYESSLLPAGQTTSFSNYHKNMKEDQKKIYYLTSPSRELAETSPYLEALKEKNVEVLFCYQQYDEAILMQLKEFSSCPIISVENELRRSSSNEQVLTPGGLTENEVDSLTSWIKSHLKDKVDTVRVNSKLDTHPCIITVEEMSMARHFIKTQKHGLSDDMIYSLLRPRFEINPKHPVIKKLSSLKESDVQVAELLTEQLYKNCLVTAGLIQDPRSAIQKLNEIFELMLKKF